MKLLSNTSQATFREKNIFCIAVIPVHCFQHFFVVNRLSAGRKFAIFLQRLNSSNPGYDHKEEFDPSLKSLNTVDKLVAFCDGLYMEKATHNSLIQLNAIYPDIVSSVVRKRFYHGYSTYGLRSNYLSAMVSGVTINGLNAIVVPNDILKYPYAACSQQSIVFMEILQKKGFPTRKVEFKGKANGHFCFEVFYNKDWHFYDPDMEPNVAVLNAYNHPSIAFLAGNPEILLKAYHQYPKEKILDLFLTYSYGSVNTFSAPKAIIFQQVTKFFSYTIWIFFLLAFIWARKKYRRISLQYVRNSRIHLPRIQPATAPIYNPNYTAQGA